MHSDILRATNVIVQGITGTHGAFHTQAMLQAGTQIVAGTSPNKAGETIHDVPVFSSIASIQDLGIKIDASVVFVPAAHAKAAILEACEAGIPLVVVVTEGIPVHDMIAVRQRSQETGTIIIGPNCPGTLLPGINKLGIIPAELSSPGSAAIVSRSGTLTYEAVAGLSAVGIGQRYIIGIGGDRIKGTEFIDCLTMFEQDNDVDRIVLIGEIGGVSEHHAARYIGEHISKPVFAYVAGHTAPSGVQLGHAGAIMGSEDESALAKTRSFQHAGAVTAESITELIEKVAAQKVY